MSSQPPEESGSVSVQAPADPVVAIIEEAGLIADRTVPACAALAASAHQRRFEKGSADATAVNRSTFLWALGRTDDKVRSALEQNRVRLEVFADKLGISEQPEPFTGRFELGEDLARALQTFVATRRGTRLTVTPAELGVAILEDARDKPGLLGQRLRELGTDAEAVLDTLRPMIDDTGNLASSPLVRMRDISPRRFGVHIPAGADSPGPYIQRDADAKLEQLVIGREPVVAVMAPAQSGAIRSIFEILRRARPDDRVLLTDELLDDKGRSHISADDLDRLRNDGAGMVWVRNLRKLLASSPVWEEWFGRHRGDLTATLVVLLRPDDRSKAMELGIDSGAFVELSGRLSVDEQARARAVYGQVSTVAEVGRAVPRDQAGLRANYAADSAAAALVDERTDDLDIRADVDMLAKLIASKDAHPPLSIGLFGPWGSGKSFHLRQVQLRIADLADRSRIAPAGSTGYLSEIVPVEFNAWQYARGSSLWASLINRVFEGIQAKLEGDERYERGLRDIAAKNAGVEEARAKLEAARAEVQQKQDAEGDRAIQEVAEGHADIDSEVTKKLTETLDLDAATSQVSDLKQEVEDLAKFTARLRRGWSTASTARRVFIVAAVITSVTLACVVALFPSALQQGAVALAAVVSIVTAARRVVGPVNRGLRQATELISADKADKQELQKAQVDLDEATQQLAAARASGFAGLHGFVSDRSAAAEYRQELGMAPRIRDDLKQLATMSQTVDGLPGIERIVVFIDDLDRCPAAEVVRVLEAVNLLFGFELFVVVVAVDSRWLLKSLKGTFSEAFDAEEGPAPTPQNYLEKIIQIPFWLRPMQPKGFERLVTTLAGEVDGAPHRTRPGPEPKPPTPKPEAAVAPSTGDDSGKVPRSESTEPVVETPDDDRQTADLNPQALRLTQVERDFMREFLPLVGTPRAVKRFMNTYQLLRVSVGDVDAFLGRKEYRPVLILLALMTGTAPITDQMIDELRSMGEGTFKEFLERVGGEQVSPDPKTADRDRSGDWRQIVAACKVLPTATLTPAVIDAWLPKVARYSFHPVEM